MMGVCFCFFKQKTAYDMRISDWSSGVCSSDLGGAIAQARLLKKPTATWRAPMRQANQWRLISHLSLNHLSLVEGGRDALLEILSLYNFGNSEIGRAHV